MKMIGNYNGWLFLDKPIGISSNKTLQKVRKIFSNTKAGYVGTLDPLASGFLPIALGKATKTIKYLDEEIKEYIFTIRWGLATSTGDSEGIITYRKALYPDKSEILGQVEKVKKIQDQVPPKYSAIKINGERAYSLARKGKSFKMPKRKIKILGFKLLELINKSEASFWIKCSSGTYIRSLAEQIAILLNTHGHIRSLRRVGFGNLDKKLISLDSLLNLMHIDKLIQALKPIDYIFKTERKINLDSEEAKLLLHGKSIKVDLKNKSEMETVKEFLKPSVAVYKKQFVAIGNIENNSFYPKTVLNLIS